MDHSKAGVDLMLNVDEKLPASSPDSKPFDRRVVQSALCLMLQDDGDVCTIHEDPDYVISRRSGPKTSPLELGVVLTPLRLLPKAP